MDIETLQAHQYDAMENVQQLTQSILRAQTYAMRIAKRINTMQDNQTGLASASKTMADIEMEKID